MRIIWLFGLALLAGCATAPGSLPPATPPAAACQWQWPDAERGERLARVAEALEAQGFTLRDTDMALGLISAERSERIGYYADPYDRPVGGFSGIGFGIGVGIGRGTVIGYRQPVLREALRGERVALVASPDGWVRVTRERWQQEAGGPSRRLVLGDEASFCDALRRAGEEAP
ncbi:hypothetical protein [Halomonas sp. 328]|uniref:hypothetical protein n=1 Tax=Halomonas sp. 328 TaxID=2776704 RepID=UPI0018A79E78|nr:hypothetical protein [Halomonas sp. 328]MBF8222926.1 hypothetical protein [Halomonas sp. 328]